MMIAHVMHGLSSDKQCYRSTESTLKSDVPDHIVVAGSEKKRGVDAIETLSLQCHA